MVTHEIQRETGKTRDPMRRTNKTAMIGGGSYGSVPKLVRDILLTPAV